MIPRKIHYCWFSGQPLSIEFQQYIESWKRYCPDYEIIRWDENNYDIGKNTYMESAYREKRWGFVPDYARFDIIYREGGIYLDTDVELIRPLDSLLDNRCYLGFETMNRVAAGLGFGAEKGNPIIGALRDMYDHISFYQKDGSLNLTPSPEYTSARLEEFGVRMNGRFQQLEQVTVYPVDYFAPKDYATGQLFLSDNTYSIHNFSCTWMTREEKLAEERRLFFCNHFGNRIGNRIDGAYRRVQRLGETEKPCNSYKCNLAERVQERIFYSDTKNENRLRALENLSVLNKKDNDRVVLLTPALRTGNLGDLLIERSCLSHFPLGEGAVSDKVSTHIHPSRAEQKQMRDAGLLLVAGSNLLSGNVRHSQWKLPADFTTLSQICLMGCGWSDYSETDAFSTRFYRRLLNNGKLHSVRDRCTESRLKAIGMENVLYTGCPTMWDLTESHCRDIPICKSDCVVTALTCYQADYLRDGQQLQLLFSLYKEVFFWPQSAEDTHYLMKLLTREEKIKITILPRDWNAFKNLLCTKRPDYVGNRLHAGIFALRSGCRSRIIAIDNRAAEIGKDTNLPVISRNDIAASLEKSIFDESPLLLKMPWENIRLWLQQFKKGTR